MIDKLKATGFIIKDIWKITFIELSAVNERQNKNYWLYNALSTKYIETATALFGDLL